MNTQSIKNSAHTNWLPPGTAILGGQAAPEWHNWVLHYFCVLVTRAELSVFHMGVEELWGGMNQHDQCLGKELGSVGALV